MPYRWLILFVLFVARTTMAFQYQSVAALSPSISESYLASLSDIGLLIGLYLGPGVIVAFPGGALAARFGDRRVVGFSLVVMMIGGSMMAYGDDWEVLLLGRVLAGIGGVVINVVMTKMLVDWFSGHEIGTAMGIFIGSWPIGIALALAVLPGLATSGGLVLGWLGVVCFVALALALFAIFYRPAPGSEAAATTVRVRSFPVGPLLTAALIWALFNTALAMVFGFGPLLLSERGFEAMSASSIISLFTLMVGLGVPLGGFLSDRFGVNPVVLFSLVGSAVFLPVLTVVPNELSLAVFSVSGLVMGLAAGPIMTMPSQVLRPEARAFGMGVFFSIYYAVMMVGPAIGGKVADMQGWAGAALLLGSLMLGASIVLLAVFRQTRPAPV